MGSKTYLPNSHGSTLNRSLCVCAHALALVCVHTYILTYIYIRLFIYLYIISDRTVINDCKENSKSVAYDSAFIRSHCNLSLFKKGF